LSKERLRLLALSEQRLQAPPQMPHPHGRRRRERPPLRRVRQPQAAKNRLSSALSALFIEFASYRHRARLCQTIESWPDGAWVSAYPSPPLRDGLDAAPSRERARRRRKKHHLLWTDRAIEA
jgi:hypothetical protein